MTPIDNLRLPAPYDVVLQEAVTFIQDQYEPIGIVAAGSSIRGLPDPMSDFDIVVAHDTTWRQRAQRRFNGVPAEIFVNPPFQIRRAFRMEAAEARPTMAHMLASGVILVDPRGIMAELATEAKAVMAAGPPPLSDTALIEARYMIATAFEDAEDLRERDTDRAVAMAIVAVLDAIRLHYHQSGRWHPREKELLTALEVSDPELGSLARAAIRATPVDARIDAAREIVARIVGVTEFFAWDSPPQQLPPDEDPSADGTPLAPAEG